MSAAPMIGILLVNYFSCAEIARLLKELCEDPGRERFNLSIVDNSLNTLEWEKIRALEQRFVNKFNSLTIVRAASNLGYGSGNNLAATTIEHLNVDVLFILNPDVSITSGYISEAAEEIIYDPNFKLFSAKTRNQQRFTSGLSRLSALTGKSSPLPIEPFKKTGLIYPGGHFLGLTKHIWDVAEGFSNLYFLYSEEVDLVLRLGTRPNEIRDLESVSIAHIGGYSVSATRNNDKLPKRSLNSYFYSTRSRVVLFKIHPKLRIYLIPLLFSRTAWAMRTLASGNWKAGWVTILGILSGLNWIKTNNESSVLGNRKYLK